MESCGQVILHPFRTEICAVMLRYPRPVSLNAFARVLDKFALSGAAEWISGVNGCMMYAARREEWGEDEQGVLTFFKPPADKDGSATSCAKMFCVTF